MTTPSLPLTQTAISDCRYHLAQFPDADPAIGAYLTRYTNGLMCAEIEKVVNGLIRDRLEKGCSDSATRNFLASLRRGVIRNATFSEIRGKMKILGPQYDSEFQTLFEKTVEEGGKEKLGIAVENRDTNAHDDPVDITLNELEDAFAVAVKMVDAVKNVLSN